MAKQSESTNGHIALEQALAQMIQNQAALLATEMETKREAAEIRRDMHKMERDTDAKFAEVIRILNEHSRLIERLTEAVRDRIGFKAT